MPLTFRGHLRITPGVEATSEIKSYGERRIRMKMKQVLQDFSENVSVRKDIILRSSQQDSKLLLQAAKRVRCSELN